MSINVALYLQAIVADKTPSAVSINVALHKRFSYKRLLECKGVYRARARARARTRARARARARALHSNNRL